MHGDVFLTPQSMGPIDCFRKLANYERDGVAPISCRMLSRYCFSFLHHHRVLAPDGTRVWPLQLLPHKSHELGAESSVAPILVVSVTAAFSASATARRSQHHSGLTHGLYSVSNMKFFVVFVVYTRAPHGLLLLLIMTLLMPPLITVNILASRHPAEYWSGGRAGAEESSLCKYSWPSKIWLWGRERLIGSKCGSEL